jgi:hypothetical protein
MAGYSSFPQHRRVALTTYPCVKRLEKRPKADECPSKVANNPHIDSGHSKSLFPYSSTKHGFVNNPG